MTPDMTGARERLLAAAGEVFAQRGFRAATIREICSQAGVNVAAVNYYFHDKQQLYSEVLKHAHRYAIECYPPDGGLPLTAPAEDRLRAFVSSFIRRMTDSGRPAWHGLLMIREITEPTPALDELVDQSVRPQVEILTSILQALLGPHVTAMQIRLCASSVMGQCMHFQISREVLTRLNPALVYDADTVNMMAEHVVRFSLAGIAAMRAANDGESRDGR